MTILRPLLPESNTIQVETNCKQVWGRRVNKNTSAAVVVLTDSNGKRAGERLADARAFETRGGLNTNTHMATQLEPHATTAGFR